MNLFLFAIGLKKLLNIFKKRPTTDRPIEKPIESANDKAIDEVTDKAIDNSEKLTCNSDCGVIIKMYINDIYIMGITTEQRFHENLGIADKSKKISRNSILKFEVLDKLTNQTILIPKDPLTTSNNIQFYMEKIPAIFQFTPLN